MPSLITINDIMSLECFEQRDEHVPAQTLSNVVKSITIMDTVRINQWVNEKELLIIGDYFEEFIEEEYLIKLGQLNIAGIITKEKYLKYITPEMSKICKSLNIPVLTVKSYYSWSQVMTPILKMISDRNYLILTDNLNFHKTLIKSLSKQNFDSFCNLISSITNYSLAIVNNNYSLLDYSKDYDWKNYFSDFHFDTVSKKINLGIDINNHYLYGYTVPSTNPELNNVHAIIFPLNNGHKSLGYLFLLNKENLSPHYHPKNHYKFKLNPTVNTRILTIIEAYFLKNKLSSEFYKSQTHFTNSIFNSIVKSEETMNLDKDKFKYIFDTIFDSKFRVINVASPLFDKDIYTLNYNDWFSEFCRFLKNDNMNDKEILIFYSNNQLIFIVPEEAFNENIFKNIKRILISFFEFDNFKFGISNIHNFENIKIAYKEAFQAVMFLNLNLSTNLQYYSEIGILSIFMDESGNMNNDFMNKMVDQYIKPLKEHDKNYKSDLIGTLKTFLENDCKYKNSSEILFIHINTLRARLNTIEKLLNVKMNSTNDIVNLSIALNCYNLFMVY